MIHCIVIIIIIIIIIFMSLKTENDDKFKCSLLKAYHVLKTNFFIFIKLLSIYKWKYGILIQWKLLSTKNQLFKKWMLIVDRWKQFHKHLPPPICDMKNVNHLKQLYNKATINNCLANVQIVGHNEKTDCFGLLQVRWQGASMYIVYI